MLVPPRGGGSKLGALRIMSEPRTLGIELRDISEAVEVLIGGGIVAFPTDTVYGIGCDVRRVEAIAALYRIKRRSLDKAIPLLLASAAELSEVAQEIPQSARRLAECFWPGGLTLVVRARRGPGGLCIPHVLTAGMSTVAVRVPDHDVVRALVKGMGAPLAATSANISGQSSPVTAEEVRQQLAGRIDLLLDGGPCPGGVASTVVDVSDDSVRVLREGPITVEQVETSLAQGGTMGCCQQP